MTKKNVKRLQQCTALALVLMLAVGSATAGITVSGADGITVSGADGVTYVGTSGITASGADGFLAFGVNGITASGADGITASGADGITASGADSVTYLGANGITASGADGITISGADGITASGADGITVSGADGTRYQADSVFIREANGITASGADNVRAIGADGITASGADGITASGADGMTILGADGITVSGADGITAIAPDGRVFSISPNGITISGADGITASGADGITISGADTISVTVPNGITASGADTGRKFGLQSIDPELALRLNEATDDSNINAVIVYHKAPTASDITDLQRIGVLGGTRFRVLPVISVSATREQIIAISHLSTVRSIYGNRTLQSTADTSTTMVGVERVRRDADLTLKNNNMPVSGRGVTVAVLDTGLDGTHRDLSGRVARNVKLADTQSVGIGFNYYVSTDNLPNTDQVYGHGTFVGGVIAGNGARSNGKYQGVAPGARLVGLSAGDLTLSFVLAGFDYLLANASTLNTRVVNCSFSSNTVFDFNDPVNVATRMLVERGVNVVFSAGNTGDGLHTLNPYAVAPWVISVGATDERARLASFSSRGAFGSTMFRPTLVAPGVDAISLRSSTVASVTGTTGITLGADRTKLTPAELLHYTTASGTSFSAPMVAGAIALMLEANPRLNPDEVRDILQRTATPLPNYYQHEIGAGMLNVHAAVLEAAFPSRKMGLWRAALDRGQVRFINEEWQEFSGTVPSGKTSNTTVTIPDNTLMASVQIAWGPFTSTNDLGLYVYDAGGVKQDESAGVNQPGLTGKRERVVLKSPTAGAWRASVSNALGSAGSPQPFTGAIELTRVEYAPLADLQGLSASSRDEIYQALRSYTMTPYGGNFRPNHPVTRAELAMALVVGARVPQYLPGQPRYTDVSDLATMIFVESVQAAPGGPLFYDAASGGSFHPFESVDRLTAAVALVRAAGLQAEADQEAQAFDGIGGESSEQPLISKEMLAYIKVAMRHNLLDSNNPQFDPSGALTRAELAHAMSAIAKLAAQ